MKVLSFYCLASLIALNSFPQNSKNIQKAWVKTSIENLSDRAADPDTMYIRYTFERAKLYISFYPAWDSYTQEWSMKGQNLTIGFDTYKIEELTDTSLIISAEGFRRFRFLSEEYLTNQDKNLIQQGEFNGKPLYKATKYISPRYSKKTSLRDVIQKDLEGYNIKRAAYFYLTFIVTEDGRVENVKVVQGISEGFDKEIVRNLVKTSKDWKPAYFKGKPIQTEMYYDIKYLDSIVPYSSGGN